MRLSGNVFLIEIVACLGNSDLGERCIGEVNGSEGAACASKIRLVESVIMNNASCAPVTLGELSFAPILYRRRRRQRLRQRRREGLHSRFIACSKFSSLGSNACPSRETIYGK